MAHESFFEPLLSTYQPAADETIKPLNCGESRDTFWVDRLQDATLRALRGNLAGVPFK